MAMTGSAVGGTGHRAIADGDWKLAVYADREHLFHLAADPGEVNNLVADAPERAAALRRALDAWSHTA